jgi:hypothetical protein
MAVAPVALEMGPRNSRRLTTSAVSLAAVAVISVSGLWFFGGLPFVSSASHSNSSTPVERVIILIPQRPGLPFGMTKQQMIHRLGRPERIAGQCLQYSENIKDFVGGTINAVRMCFWNGQYQHWYMERNGTWRDPYDGTGAVIAPPTKP